MRTRIIAAFIAIPIVIIPIYLGGIWGLLFGVVVTVVGCLEMFDMLRKGGYNVAVPGRPASASFTIKVS